MANFEDSLAFAKNRTDEQAALDEEDADIVNVGLSTPDSAAQLYLSTNVQWEDLERGDINLLYTHPETLMQKKVRSLLRSKVYQTNVCAVVVDEVHMISEWGEEFRPAFKSLGELTCLFPACAHLALTATATSECLESLVSVLNYKSAKIVRVNPDRPNIFLEVRKGLPNIQRYKKIDSLIEPLIQELQEKKIDFPLTIVYMGDLDSLGYCYTYIEYMLGDDAFIGEKIPENRIFAQYHKDYTNDMKNTVVQELVKEKPILRLVLATVALGMGLNAPSIERIIHFRPPTTLEKYMQEIGRAGRMGQKAKAILYFNNSDIAKNRKGLSDSIVRYCRSESCLRMELVKHFGFEQVVFCGLPSDCCSICQVANRND